ncbi:hypothetical protein [Deinococcus radiodurans]|jgi:hypothetical protein|uniref:hypothetical protein n=1 Tax=Deinococcus radiodurans TaxID=1299 RepID=UPI0002FD52AF|nr:hypothetical protein [Deinococcus radiodurans]ANC71924.1 hypothetical protein A2G07_09160 [Deinococcus radiodurans R1 = ATCC 13939 = DSM 20539]QIP28988.1 hypothetical protein HAV23_07275 [Deinococcus radiodurans]QIP32303.1 hypothetical protein HAV35_09515 [Deinococcus radiodurans]UID69865.1 hypothetical protein DRO_0865 [Deinococcus radiodurans R1 = ATCC 13939 = DSM 20539]UTA50420.1 hypothetical protein MSS93_11940 [Deinococcus radiodurans]
MSVKDNFTADEWFKVMTGPGRAGAAVVAASPSGLTGLLAEAQAIAASVRESVSGTPRTPLMEAMAAELLGTPPDPKDLPQQNTRDMEEVKAQSIEGVRQAAWLVSSKASPEDAAAYRQMLLKVVENTANAAKEGGFLGIGGEQVNDKERAVMDELRQVIGGDQTNQPTVVQETLPESTGTTMPAPDGSGNSN